MGIFCSIYFVSTLNETDKGIVIIMIVLNVILSILTQDILYLTVYPSSRHNLDT